MKTLFLYSARGTTTHGDLYKKIHGVLLSLGHEDIGEGLLEKNPDKFYTTDHESHIQHYKDMNKALKKCDVLVLEVSVHSLSMGFHMRSALAMGKPVIALHLKGKEPVFATGIEDEKLQVIEYEEEQVAEVISAALDYADGISDVRFNFFISPAIGQYLDWISKHKKIPRSVYLRTLIERDMAEDEEYHSV